MKITEIAIKRPAFLTMFFSALAVLGIYSYLQMGTDLLPKMSWPFVAITTLYPGAGPKEVESQVSKPIEEALSSLPGLKSLRTYSNENVSLTWVEFNMSVDVDVALNDVERKINEIRLQFPQDVRQPQISKADLNTAPILRIAALSSFKDQEFFQFIKDKIKPKLEQVPGVAGVSIVGGKEREIRIEVDNQKLQAYDVSLEQVARILAAQNIDFPTGAIEQKSHKYIVRLVGKVSSLDDLRTIILSKNGARTIYVKDIAEVIDAYKEDYTIGRLNRIGCIGISIVKASDANAVKCRDLVGKQLASLEKEYADNNLRFTVAQDITHFTKKSISDIQHDFIVALIMVALVLLLFLHSPRSAVIVLMAIPISIITACIAMNLFDFTINIITTLALTLVIGILVDDSIVVLENIQRHLEKGEEPRSAALRGRSEIGLAAIAITLVDVVVFLPMAMLSGIVGKIFREFGITVVASTLVSLLVSFTLTPMLASRFAGRAHFDSGSLMKKIVDTITGAQNSLAQSYRRILGWALSHKKTVIVISAALLLASLSLLPLGFISSEFIPNLDRGEFALDIDMPAGSSIEATNEATAKIENIVAVTPGVEKYYCVVGRREGAYESQENASISQIEIKLSKSNKLKTQAVINDLLRKANRIPGVEAKASLIGLFGAADETPIAIEVKGEDMEALVPASETIRNIALSVPGTRDVQSTWESGQPELQVRINREQCARRYLTLGEVGCAVRTALQGDVCSKFTDNSTDYDIRVILSRKDRTDPDKVGRITLMNSLGQTILLRDIARIYYGNGPTEISRKDRCRVITILSNLNGTRQLGEVAGDINKKIKEARIPSGVTVFFGGDVEDMEGMMKDMGMAIGFAVLFVYMIMVSLFESYLYPFIIMFSIPLALVGGLIALAITGQSLSLVSMIGILLAIGLVTKNAILLVDYTNTLRKRGLKLYEALLEAGPVRLRPILMTTLTMVFGMLPLAVSFGSAGSLKKGMAVIVIGSLLSSTFLTLVLVPVIYTVLEGVKEKVRKMLKPGSS